MTIIRNTYLLWILLIIHCENCCGICSFVRIHEKQVAAATISMIDAVVVTVSLHPCITFLSVSSLYRSPSSTAYTIATVPASEAVKTPILTPPIIMIGKSNGRNAGLTAAIFSETGILVVLLGRYPLFLDKKCVNIINVTQRTIPGPIPAMNSLPIDMLLIQP